MSFVNIEVAKKLAEEGLIIKMMLIPLTEATSIGLWLAPVGDSEPAYLRLSTHREPSTLRLFKTLDSAYSVANSLRELSSVHIELLII
ncbi:MAG: hypothetical protein [Inoviridae sp.]|nr:MAG: hypothetical protein [Inoviridae sp.]